MLDPTNGLHLVGVSLGAELIVVSVLALVSVSLQDVLVATVTRELIGHPAAKRKRQCVVKAKTFVNIQRTNCQSKKISVIV